MVASASRSRAAARFAWAGGRAMRGEGAICLHGESRSSICQEAVGMFRTYYGAQTKRNANQHWNFVRGLAALISWTSRFNKRNEGAPPGPRVALWGGRSHRIWQTQ
eukprot:5375659-Pyramimonas_sp.AAC.1